MTVTTERELDALAPGTRLRFTVSGATVRKLKCGLFEVDGVKGVWMPEDLCTNNTPLEIID